MNYKYSRLRPVGAYIGTALEKRWLQPVMSIKVLRTSSLLYRTH